MNRDTKDRIREIAKSMGATHTESFDSPLAARTFALKWMQERTKEAINRKHERESAADIDLGESNLPEHPRQEESEESNT